MAKLELFDRKVETVRVALGDLREETAQSTAALARIAAAEGGMEGGELDAQAARVAETIRRQEAIVATIAELVFGLDQAAAAIAGEFEAIKRFTRRERFVAFFSARKAARMRHSRTMEHTLAARLEDLLSKSGAILRLIEDERAFASEQQQRAEGDLVHLIERRKGTARLLDLAARQPDESGLFAEDALLERATSIFRALVESLNDGIAAMQTLLNKLAIDGQQRRLLCRAVEGWGFGGFTPGVAGEIHATSQGAQTAREIRRRKTLADDAFARRFVRLLEKHDASG
ncbi:hypothetical protein DFR48_101167 [Ciceribacter lividus]|uniref:Uncharacterized protein n=1 Tax=Ciceribacter lividus TaxID=1197950 RepID=A0A6I7HSI0_9HYPH|nr:hypothetical protein [Ciceribacter lividus]RCW28158.1 hypothetical protein DFR48_101167 [Ciceribacter lividus]